MNTDQSNKLIKLPEVMDRTTRSKSSIYSDIKKGEFPKPVKIGVRGVAFIESEINEWLNKRIEASQESA